MYGPTANPARILPALVDQMLDHGYQEEDIYKILGVTSCVFSMCAGGGADVGNVETPAFHEDWR